MSKPGQPDLISKCASTGTLLFLGLRIVFGGWKDWLYLAIMIGVASLVYYQVVIASKIASEPTDPPCE